MSTNIEYSNEPRRGKAIAGMILLVVGTALLLRQFDFFFFPSWIISWPMLFIVWGLYTGVKHNFRSSASFLFILLGIVFLLIDEFNVSSGFVWPMALIAVGIWIIIKRSHPTDHDYWEKRWGRHWDWRQHTYQNQNDPANDTKTCTTDYWEKRWGRHWDWRHHAYAKQTGPAADDTKTGTTADNPLNDPGPSPTGDDYMEVISVFGGVKKTIFSKNFKGGEVVNIFGGTEVDFTQADINGRVYIDLTQIFGGVKMIVPSHWMVISDMASIFAGFEDKRVRTSAPLDTTKVLILKGTSVFAGVDIRSY